MLGDQRPDVQPYEPGSWGPAAADALLRRASELSPPPGDVTVGRILRGDRRALWTWSDSLPLPPPKKWWRHWRDAIPLGLS